MTDVIGVDVGGTYTDAVIVRNNHVLSFCKSQTTSNRTGGILEAIKGAFKKLPHDLKESISLSRVCIGTTHFINAVVERSRNKLAPVAVVRLCGPASIAVPPFSDFPVDLATVVKADYFMVSGGLEYHGAVIKPVCVDEIKSLAKELLSRSPPIKNIVLSGVFSSLASSDTNQELLASKLFNEVSNEFSITIACKIGKLGLIERENAAILNESLKPFAVRTMSEFKTALESLQFNCPFYLTQNDGTLISVEEAMEYPILTFSSGSTNSMRGAMHLSGIMNAIVVDIGGTTTDVGVLVNGFPREASSQVKVGGVRTNFRMPNVISIGLGGGSIVNIETDEVLIGPDSVGLELPQRAICFGGDTCTATDIAIAAGLSCKGLPCDKKELIIAKFGSIIYQSMRNMKLKIEEAIDLVKTTKEDAVVLLVGGGSVLIDDKVHFKGASKVLIPPYFEVANAVGASLGMVSGQCHVVERISAVIGTHKLSSESNDEEKLQEEARKIIIEKCTESAIQNARSKGCVPGSEYIHEKEVMNVTYVPDALDVHVKVIGCLQQEPSQAPLSAPSMSNDDEAVRNVMTASDVWPYYSQDEKTLDIQAGLPLPLIDSITGEWVLNEEDVECISIGAGILGCGGGGDPNIGRVIASEMMKQGKNIKLINPLSVKNESVGLLAAVAFMGAPVILKEKVVNGNETILCLQTIQKILASGVCKKEHDFGKTGQNGVAISVRVLDSGESAWIVDHSTLPDCSLGDDTIPINERITGLVAAEVGGANSFEPLVVGAKVGLPVLDADGMGRAFPELQMFTPFIYGLQPFPSCVADEKGNIVAISHISTAKGLEEVFRTECIKMGMSCGICIRPMSLRQVLDTCVLQSYSRAWRIGRAIVRARRTHDNIIQSVAQQQDGSLLLSGKVVDLKRYTEGAFTGSVIIVKGTGQFSNVVVEVKAKNEYFVVQEITEKGSVGKVLAVTPDLITILDTDTGYPITTENIKYGLRVSVLILPASPILVTEKALAVVGPAAFQLHDVLYSPPKTTSTHNNRILLV